MKMPILTTWLTLESKKFSIEKEALIISVMEKMMDNSIDNGGRP
jgi:hypothetical protein